MRQIRGEIPPSLPHEDKLMSSRAHGFSLLEVLIITGLAMLLAAALIPRLLNSRVAANEATAVANVDIITSAQQSYKTAYPAIGYADSLARLAGNCDLSQCRATADHACLIDCHLPEGVRESRGGYFYGLSAASPAGFGPNSTYVVVAAAETVHKTGEHDFCAVEDARIRWQTPVAATPASSITHSVCQQLPVMP
ncbi:MAG TPA: pili assembly chaperone [Terriglobales bacterium]|nr:pili assembly chaperone [Terriglobales bacterium]